MNAESFGAWLRQQRELAGISQDELAGAADVGKAFISKLENATPHSTTGTVPSPSLETFLAIVKKLNVPVTKALEVYGFVEADTANIELHKLQNYFLDLPRDCQLDVLALTEALWRRRRAEGRAERTAGGKHRPQSVTGGRPKPRRKTGTND